MRYFIVAATLCLSAAAAALPNRCGLVWRELGIPGLLPIPANAVSSLRENHWTAFETRPELRTPTVMADLRAAFDRVQTEHGYKVSPGRVQISGLESFLPSPGEINIAKGLSPETIRIVDAVAGEALRVAREATGEDLVITDISVGRGFRVGNEEGTLIHNDTMGTYLHGTVSLEGPSTVVFRNSPELKDHLLISIDPNTGLMTVQKILVSGEEPPPPFTVASGGLCLPGEMVMFGGAGYAAEKTGRVALQHASPPQSDLNRLTLFIGIKPRGYSRF